MRILFVAILGLSLPAVLEAGPKPATSQKAAVTYPQFAVAVHTEDGGSLSYRLLIPKDYSPAKAWPLVVWLHGSGEKGTDNAAPLRATAETFLGGANPAKYPAFVLVPQCPPADSWAPVGVNKAPAMNAPVRMTIATIAELQKEFRLDDRRVYIGGFSMGGIGVWEFLGRFPNLFAAAFPIAGTVGEQVALAPVLKGIPIWIFQGDKDGNVGVEGARKMATALKAVGGNVKYSEYAGMGHECARPLAEPGLPEWLFAQKRQAAPSFTPADLPEGAALTIKAMPAGTHGTWTGPAQRTAHLAPRVEIDGTRYRMKPAAAADPVVAALLERIGKGQATGRFRVTGTVEHSDYVWLVVESISPAP